MSGHLRVISLCVAVLAVLTAAATAVRSVSRIWLRHWVEQQLRDGNALDGYLAQPQRLLLAAAAGGCIVMLIAGTVLGAAPVENSGLLVLQTLLAVVLLMVFGQLVPRAIARRWASTLAPVLMPVLRAVAFLVHPFIWSAQRLSRPLRVSRITPNGGSSRDGLEDLLREGELEGIGEPEEIEIITGVVEFGEKTLRDVMTPRTAVFAIEASTPPKELAEAIATSGYSRVPVYHETLDDIRGIVHVFDVFKLGGDERPPIRPVAHAPVSKRCSEMLFEMLRAQRHLAVVLDEYGGTAGIVTLEDVLEELVGDIRDEHDEPVESAATTMRAAVIDAGEPLGEIAERLGIPESERDAMEGVSVGGMLVRAAGRIPVVGERFRVGSLELVVIEASTARVARVLVQRVDSIAPHELPLSH